MSPISRPSKMMVDIEIAYVQPRFRWGDAIRNRMLARLKKANSFLKQNVPQMNTRKNAGMKSLKNVLFQTTLTQIRNSTMMMDHAINLQKRIIPPSTSGTTTCCERRMFPSRSVSMLALYAVTNWSLKPALQKSSVPVKLCPPKK